MDNLPFPPGSQFPHKKSVSSLLGSLKSQKGNARAAKNTALTSLASKRSSDTIKYTYMMLKNRLANDLDATLAIHQKDYPETKDNLYIAIITDENNSIEVVNKDEALGSVVDMNSEEAEEVLNRDPIGFFTRENFGMKTPNSEAHKALKNRLEDYFKRNSEVIRYLQSNPDMDIKPEDLYHEPNRNMTP